MCYDVNDNGDNVDECVAWLKENWGISYVFDVLI